MDTLLLHPLPRVHDVVGQRRGESHLPHNPRTTGRGAPLFLLFNRARSGDLGRTGDGVYLCRSGSRFFCAGRPASGELAGIFAVFALGIGRSCDTLCIVIRRYLRGRRWKRSMLKYEDFKQVVKTMLMDLAEEDSFTFVPRDREFLG